MSNRYSFRQMRSGAPTCTNCLLAVKPFCVLRACFEGVQMAAIEIVMSEIDIFVPSTGSSNFFTLEQMKKLDNNAVVGKSVNLQRDRFGWPRGLGNQSRQHQASRDRFVLLVGHDVIVLVPGPQDGSASCQMSSVTKVKAISGPHYRYWAVSFNRWCCRWQLLLSCVKNRKQVRNQSLQVAFVISWSLPNQILAQLDAQ